MMENKKLFIFDMDGVLLDSEPFWREAQISLLQDFGENITEEDCIRLTMGKRIDNITRIWIDKYGLSVSEDKLTQLLLDEVVQLINLQGKAKSGIYTLIDFLQKQGWLLALATSSSEAIISAVINKLELSNVFELTLSADEVPNGKPSPDVYLEVCHRLGVSTDSAIALEDSLTGVRASVSANITTIAIPEIPEQGFEMANHIIENAEDAISIVKNDTRFSPGK
jgi:sugar-phosphatase